MKILLIRLFLVSTCLSPLFALAEEPGNEDYLVRNEEAEIDVSDGIYPFDEDDDSSFEFLNSPHSVVSDGVETVAKYMDIFFADEKIYQESTKSYAILSGKAITDKHGETRYAGDLRIKIDLPKTKKKMKLVLESDTEQELQSGLDHPAEQSPGKAASEADYYAALQRELAEFDEWKFYSSLGLKLRIPLDPFLRIRATRLENFAKWKMRFSETLFWFDSLGTGAASLLEFDRTMYNNLLFRSTSSAIWKDETDDYELTQSFKLFHEITERRAVSYTIAAYGTNKPTIHSTSYLFNIRYRQRIHKDWLFIEIKPEVLYERENDFHPEPTLTLQVDMIFGNKYVQ